ncbi:MAG: hypothetical protein ACRC2V_21930 [Xenococcaceae cyanobacterium]
MSEIVTTTQNIVSNKAFALASIQDLEKIASLLFSSGLCPSVKSVAQAATIILAGHELGLQPFAALSNLQIITGKVCLSANFISQLIKGHPFYDYRILRCDNEGCEVEIRQKEDDKWEVLGISSFYVEDAERAGLLVKDGAGNIKKDNWRQYPADMYFARAISRGMRRFCPDVAQGLAIYEINEMKDSFESSKHLVSKQIESNGATEWREPAWNNLEDAILWAQELLSIDEDCARKLYDRTPADLKTGKKGSNFIGIVRACWENGGEIPDELTQEVLPAVEKTSPK